MKTLSKNKERAFELLKLVVNEPRFDKDPVERMSKANQSRIRSSLSDPDWIAARLMNDVAFAGHPYALNSGGTLSTLNAITPADLKAFHKARLGRNNVMVAVSGDITPEEVRIRLDELFGDLPEASLTPPADLTVQNSGKTFVYERDMPQTLIEIMQPGIDTHDPDYHAAQVMNFILGSSGFGSRLTTEIREKRGLTYGIYSTFYNLDHLFGFTVSTSTKNENVPEMLSLIQKEFQTMLSDNVSKKELEDAKSYLIGSLPLSLTSTDKIAGLLLSLQLNGRLANYLELRENAIESVSVKDVRRVAERILTPENFTTVLVGKPEGLDNATPIKKIPNAE
ncbi:MAG: pitrilysin family protein [Alphaproteobacteria bacterium]